MPVYVTGWDAKALKARIVFGAPDQQELVAPQDVQERRYALRTVKQRLHQASFREAVISAYQGSLFAFRTAGETAARRRTHHS